jgi:hypothetical protein
VSATTDRQTAGEAVGGFLAACALLLGFLAIAYRPARLSPLAVVLVLLAAVMGGRRHERLVIVAVVVVSVGWLVGMTVAVATNNPLY